MHGYLWSVWGERRRCGDRTLVRLSLDDGQKDIAVFTLALPAQTGILMIFLKEDPNQQLERRICELDGISKLIEGVIAMVNTAPREKVCDGLLG